MPDHPTTLPQHIARALITASRIRDKTRRRQVIREIEAIAKSERPDLFRKDDEPKADES
jgi:hypothetical protein